MYQSFSSLNQEEKFKTALKTWHHFFGDDCEMVSFEIFLSTIEDQLHFSENGKKYFTFCTNFPEDNIMTAYRFQILCYQFGSWLELAENFEQFVCHPPFIGLVNAIDAQRFLLPNTYILRFSRTYPQSLCLSYCYHDHKTLRYRHIRTGNGNMRNCIKKLLYTRPLMTSAQYHFDALGHDVLNHMSILHIA